MAVIKISSSMPFGAPDGTAKPNSLSFASTREGFDKNLPCLRLARLSSEVEVSTPGQVARLPPDIPIFLFSSVLCPEAEGSAPGLITSPFCVIFRVILFSARDLRLAILSEVEIEECAPGILL